MNPLQALHAQGQSIWLDYIRRKLLTGGELSRLIDEDSVTGMTSNPAIFQKAITGSTDYSEAIAALARDESLDAKTLVAMGSSAWKSRRVLRTIPTPPASKPVGSGTRSGVPT
jgi:transaldolase